MKMKFTRDNFNEIFSDFFLLRQQKNHLSLWALSDRPYRFATANRQEILFTSVGTTLRQLKISYLGPLLGDMFRVFRVFRVYRVYRAPTGRRVIFRLRILQLECLFLVWFCAYSHHRGTEVDEGKHSMDRPIPESGLTKCVFCAVNVGIVRGLLF
jgi:hypothetical protein